MLQSMTAFTREQTQINSMMVCWEIRSVNHRYLEAGFRLPEMYRPLEANLREILRSSVSRGKIECHLKVENALNVQGELPINHTFVERLILTSEALANQYELPNDLSIQQVLSWPGVVEQTPKTDEAMLQKITEVFSHAIEQLKQHRAQEGSRLRDFIIARLDLLEQEIEKASEVVSQAGKKTREKLLNRLEQLPISVTDSRFEQEIALMLAKLDVSEELDRLQLHVKEVSQTLSQSKPVGRRLDFLMQELNREANTLSSKSDSAMLTKHAVEMKVLIEQMREQIQNIE